MIEFIVLTALFYLFFNRKKKPKRAQSIEGEYRQLIESSADATAIALEIKTFLLDVLADNQNDRERFSDSRLAQAQAIIDRAGPNAMYWLADIATQFAMLSAAQINKIPTNIDEQFPESASPEALIHAVVKI